MRLMSYFGFPPFFYFCNSAVGALLGLDTAAFSKGDKLCFLGNGKQRGEARRWEVGKRKG